MVDFGITRITSSCHEEYHKITAPSVEKSDLGVDNYPNSMAALPKSQTVRQKRMVLVWVRKPRCLT
jgi:hydroxyacyl-ACP dehydratase HTD2-like protein with hotdog domain